MSLSCLVGNILSLAEPLLLSTPDRAGSGERIISSLLALLFNEPCEDIQRPVPKGRFEWHWSCVSAWFLRMSLCVRDVLN